MPEIIPLTPKKFRAGGSVRWNPAKNRGA